MFNMRISNSLNALIDNVCNAYDVSRGKVFKNTANRIQSGRIAFTVKDGVVNIKNKDGKTVIQKAIAEMYYNYKLNVQVAVRDIESLPDGVSARLFRMALAANCLYELDKYTAREQREKERIAALDKQYQNGRDYISETPMRVAELRALQGW